MIGRFDVVKGGGYDVILAMRFGTWPKGPWLQKYYCGDFTNQHGTQKQKNVAIGGHKDWVYMIPSF